MRDLKLMNLEEAVRRLTLLPAERVGLTGRGVLHAGAAADIAVFDYDAVAYTGTIEKPREHPPGFVHVLVNGAFAVEGGQRTEADAGEVLRRAA